MSFLNSLGLFFLRLGVGFSMIWFHGLPKLLDFGEKAQSFPDPIGLGSAFSLAMAVFSEFFCSILIIWGILTRLSALPLLITMLTAAFIIHGDDPWEQRELALLYALIYFCVILTGPGKISIDHFLFGKKPKPKTVPPSQLSQ